MGVAGDDARDLLAAARLHDIGKACIPKRLLEKSGPLTDEEWALMRQHTVIGEQVLSSIPELETVARLVRGSHERWDGGGYPDGLAGPEIPLGSRIIICADAFHAIRCDRPYRPGRPANEALAEVSRCAGTQFDPSVVDALERVVRERTRQPGATARSSRLLALLMCLVIGGAGTAVARSGVLGEGGGSPPQASATPPACGTAGCPTVAGPVGGFAPVGGAGWLPGPRVFHPGLPGRRHASGPGTAQGPESDHGSQRGSEGAKPKGNGNGNGKGSEHSNRSPGRSQSAGSHGHGGGSSHHSNGTQKPSGSNPPGGVSGSGQKGGRRAGRRAGPGRRLAGPGRRLAGPGRRLAGPGRRQRLPKQSRQPRRPQRQVAVRLEPVLECALDAGVEGVEPVQGERLGRPETPAS